jgi:HK97 family phage major capsid protein
MATDWSGLLPEAVSERILTATEELSVVLGLATARPMAAGVESIPLVSLAPEAEFVGRGERKPIAKIEWSAERLEAEEIACVVAVADVDIRDAGPDLEESVERELAAAVARRFDTAVLFGGGPASYPEGGIVPKPIEGEDALDALDKALSAVEGSGVLPSGIAAGAQINSALRQAYIAAAALPGQQIEPSVFGLPVRVSPRWDSSKGDALVGAFEFLQVGVRQDVEVDISSDGVLLDEEGAVQVSAFQDDQTLIRVHGRFGCAVGKPVGEDGKPVEPFAAADWT